MNEYNREDVAARVSYYGVTGVPSMIMQGNGYRGGPAGVTQDILDRSSGESSPLRIQVRESSNGISRRVDVDVTTLGQVATAGLRIRAAVIESEISYASAPGSNGETFFPNVFRRFLNTPSGEAFAPAPRGETISLFFDYELDAVWDTSKVYAIVFLQLDGSKEIVNAGAASLPRIELVNDGESFAKGTPATLSSFPFLIVNLGDTDIPVRLNFNATQKADWTAGMYIDGNPSDDEVELEIAAHSSVPISIDVTPGASAAISEYSLRMEVMSDPDLTPQHAILNVISNVTDLLVHNDNTWGNNDGTTSSDFEAAYLPGLSAAGATSIAVTSASLYERGFRLGKLIDVKHVFYNAGWAFPAITAELATVFMGLLNEGGNLFVAGQDVGWSIMDPAGQGSSAARALYRNYLFANYTNDGSTANSNVSIVGSDPLFRKLPSFTLHNVYGNDAQGNPFFFPDELRPTPEGVSIAYYNTNPSASAAIRGSKNDFKSVYFGFGMEQVVEASVRDEIMGLAWKWFHDIISSVEFDAAVSVAFLGGSYPNPASDIAVIPLGASMHARVLHMYDITGRLMMSYDVAPQATDVRINTAALRPGMYIYRLLRDGRILGSDVLQIVR